MNERILELAEQAKGFVDLNQHVGGTKGCMVYSYDGLEKFAELIVRECAEVAHCNFHVDGLTLGRILKEHFEIQE